MDVYYLIILLILGITLFHYAKDLIGSIYMFWFDKRLVLKHIRTNNIKVIDCTKANKENLRNLKFVYSE